MALEPLRTDYVDAVFDGFRKYLQIQNPDGTYSFSDVTKYIVKENAFVGAKDLNAINTAINAIMAALNNGTDLYDVFTRFFETQEELFKENADENIEVFLKYLELLKKDVESKCNNLQENYIKEMENFENVQQLLFAQWFEMIKGQLSTDAAGNLQNQINDLKCWRYVDGYLYVPYGGASLDDGYLIINDFKGGN